VSFDQLRRCGKRPEAARWRRIRRYALQDFGVSAVVIHELYYGAFKSQRVDHNVARVDALQFSVLEFDEEDARQAGQICAHLASKGTPIATGAVARPAEYSPARFPCSLSRVEAHSSSRARPALIEWNVA
jgi:hypothetical protein